ncbi:MAG TPA: hypothetical protein VLA43_15805 [Longimicrobiales bacterium]|nr:hypothetical protein [Longimicrobiales bacterium]
MPQVPFESLPDDARLWIFAVQDRLEPEQVTQLREAVSGFLEGWAAHGDPLTAGYAWVEDRFLLVAVDQRTVPPSGCSIDSLMRALKELEARFGKRLVDHGPVYLRSGAGEVIRMSRKDFRDAASSGAVTPESRVFDTTLTSLGAFRSGRMEIPARESWHGGAFF